MSSHEPAVSRNEEMTDGSRRSLFWKLAVGVSAALASTAGIARAGTDDTEAASATLLDDHEALRRLHQAYEIALDQGRYEDVVGMFATDAEVVFNGEVFRHRGQGVSRLYLERFRAGKTGKRMEPAPGFEIAAERQRERIEMSVDRRTAKAGFPFSIQVGVPVETETSLASMARLHGEGVRTWWEGGVYDVSYAKDAAGRWRITRLEYKTLSRADYRAGRSWARALSA